MAGTRITLAFVALLGCQATVSQAGPVGPMLLRKAKVAPPGPLTEVDIIRMSQRGVSGKAIIEAIAVRGKTFRFDQDVLDELKAGGVPERVWGLLGPFVNGQFIETNPIPRVPK